MTWAWGWVDVQVAILRLNALNDDGAQHTINESTGKGSAALWFLQCLLAHVVSAVDTFITGEVRAVVGARPDVMEKYLSEDARFCSRQARVPGELTLSRDHITQLSRTSQSTRSGL